MKPINISFSKLSPLTVAIGIFLSASSASATVTYEFLNGTGFDNVGLAGTDSITNGSFTFSIDTVDIIGIDGTSNVADGATHTTNIGNEGALGINSSVGTDNLTNFEVNEAWVFEFDQNLTFDSLAIASFTAGVDANLTFLDGTNSGAGTNYLLGSASQSIGYSYTAGTDIKLSFDGVGSTSDTVFRVSSLTVTAVPEINNFALQLGGCIAFGLLVRRKKHS